MCYYTFYNRPKAPRGILAAIQKYSSELPTDFYNWRDTCFERIMFFTNIGKGVNYGVCECGEHITLGAVRSNSKIRCPGCKKMVRLKKTKGQTYTQQEALVYIEPFHDGYIARMFLVHKTSTLPMFGRTEIKYSTREEERDYFDGKEIYPYHPTSNSRYSNGPLKWVSGEGIKHGSVYSGWRINELYLNTYPNNLKAMFRGTDFQYSQLETAAKVHRVSPFLYLQQYRQHPKIEIMYKLGLYGLAYEITRFGSWSYSEAEKIIKRTKSLKQLGIDSKEEIKECKWLGAEHLLARKEVKTWGIQPKDKKLAWAFIITLNRRCGNDFVYSFTSRERMFKYFKTQLNDYPVQFLQNKQKHGNTFEWKIGGISSFIRDYTDYISDCTRLNLDLNDTMIKFPKSLKTSHQWTIEECKIQETQVYDALVEAAYDSMHELVEWSDGELKIVMPRTTREIMEEGKRQSHCVGRYCERVATGESIIVFIRKVDEPEKEFYTAEIKKDMTMLDVCQCRGYKNEDAPEEILTFIEKYRKWFERRPIGDFNQDSLMVRYFKAVHKTNGRYISNADGKMEFVIGEWKEEKDIDKNPDHVAVKGLHVASMEFAQSFGDGWRDVAILEVETNIHDVIIPDAKDQVRTSRFRVVREVPFEEMGEWGEKHRPAVA